MGPFGDVQTEAPGGVAAKSDGAAPDGAPVTTAAGAASPGLAAPCGSPLGGGVREQPRPATMTIADEKDRRNEDRVEEEETSADDMNEGDEDDDEYDDEYEDEDGSGDDHTDGKRTPSLYRHTDLR